MKVFRNLEWLIAQMKCKQEKTISAKRMSVLSTSQWAWVLLGAWLTYNVMMLWHFKEQTRWNDSICKVAR